MQADQPKMKGDQSMRIMKKIAMASVMVSLCAVNAFGSGTEGERRGGRHQGPPPEAYTACEGKSAGDTAEFVSPQVIR
jgi:hypothetical protein